MLRIALQRLEKEKEFTEEQTARRDAAAGANRVMEPVAKRKLRKEIQKVQSTWSLLFLHL